MTAKQVLILIDDFSSNSVDAYDNVTLYDYGTFNKFREWDYYLNNNFTIDGYGDVDYLEPLTANTNPGFYQVAYDDKAEWAVGLDRDYAFNSGTGLGLGYYTAYWQDYYYFLAENSSLDVNIQHGDWSLYALESQLDDPSDVEIILIDVDSVDLSGQLSSLFDIVPSIYSSTGYSTNIEYILNSWLSIRGAYDSTNYIPTTLSISISGGLPDLGTTLSLGYLASLDVALVQAAPNVNQGQYDWGSVYSNVINVGAWNVDQSGEPLWSSLSTLNTLDILANGYVENIAWGDGWNFGTSFATPRVSAEIINTYAIILDAIAAGIASGEITQEDIANSPDISYQDLMGFLVNVIGTEIYIELNDFWFDSPVLVLSDDVATSPNPVTPPLTIADGVGMSGYTLTGASFSAGSNNSAPSATPATSSGNEDTPVTGTLTGTDADQDVLTYALVTDTSHGSVTIDPDTGDYTYTPDADFNGTDSFTFKVNDGTVDSSPATVTLTVAAVNDAPKATTGSDSTDEDADATGTLVASDVDQDTLKYLLVTDGAHGSVTIDPDTGDYTYTPDADFNGTDSFIYKVNDGALDSYPAKVTLTVAAVNDAPAVSAGSGITNEDTDATGTLQASDVDQDTLKYLLVTDGAHGSVTIDPDTGAYTYTPAPDFNGIDSFTFKVNDGTVDSAAATVTLTVAAVNNAPLATPVTRSGNEDTALTRTLAGTDVDHDTLTYALVTDGSHGSVTINPDTGEYTYTPDPDFNGEDSFTFKVNDGTADSLPATVTLKVAAVNDAPRTVAGLGSGNEDTAITGRLVASDVDQDTLKYLLVTDGANGSVTIDPDTGEYRYTPDADFNGTDSFTFKVNDGTVDSAAATVTLTVTAVNDAPLATPATGSGNEDADATGTLVSSDVDQDTLKYLLVGQATHGSVAINETTGAYTYTPSTDFNGTDSFTFKVNDGTVDSSVATVTLTVDAVNDAPKATTGTDSTDEDTDATGTLVASDVDQDTLKYLLVDQATHGSVAINETIGAYSYTPSPDFNGTDSFTFKVNDGTVDSAAATVTLTVVAVNDEPQGEVGISGEVEQGQLLTVTDTLTDADGKGEVTYSWFVGDSEEVAQIGSSYTLTQAEVGKSIRVVASYTDTQGSAEVVSGLATLPVANVNDAPVGFTVSVSGELVAEATLNASVEFTSDADGFDPKSGFQHNWYSSSDQENWTLIEGETASSLTLTDELVGQYIQVTASYTDDLQTVESTSAVTTAAIEALGVNVDVSAHVAAKAQTPIPGIELNGSTTNDQGLLQLTKVDGTLPMLPTKAAPSRAEASITLTDVLGALKVYLGKPLPTAYDNPYKYIAADFQGDGDVDLSDVLSLLKYYLGKPVESAPEWVFADAADEGLAADGNALSKSNATPHVIDHDLTVSSELELVGILRGDVDGSWAPPAA